jgi:hypothetical protein
MLLAESAVLIERQALRGMLLVLFGRIVPSLALTTGHGNDYPNIFLGHFSTFTYLF